MTSPTIEGLIMMTLALIVSIALLPIAAYAIGAAGNTEWPEGATMEVKLKLGATIAADGRPKITGDLTIANPSGTALIVQEPSGNVLASGATSRIIKRAGTSWRA
jgi:hypothetical protein